MTATGMLDTTSSAGVSAGALVALIETLEDADYQAVSPSFQSLTRVDTAVIIGVYVLIPVILAIVALL